MPRRLIDIQQAVRLYKAGLTLDKIGSELGFHPNSIDRAIRIMGLPRTRHAPVMVLDFDGTPEEIEREKRRVCWRRWEQKHPESHRAYKERQVRLKRERRHALAAERYVDYVVAQTVNNIIHRKYDPWVLNGETPAAIRGQEVKRMALDLLGGAICANCGCTELSFLEVNHKNGGGSREAKALKEAGKGGLGLGFWRAVLAGRRERKDLNVLCRVCNALDYLQRKNPTKAARFKITWDGPSGGGAGVVVK